MAPKWRSFRNLGFAILVSVVPVLSGHAATITWDGEAGDGLWHSARNWSGDAVPGMGDEVVVPTGTPAITVRSSVIMAGLWLGEETKLNIAGAGVAFNATAASRIDGATVIVTDGAQAVLHGIARFDMPDTDGWGKEATYWRAEGVGSVLALPDLISITGSTGWVRYLNVEALGGGVVSLPKVTTIADPSGGDSNNGIRLSSKGTTSVIDVSALTTFSDGNPASEMSWIEVADGAEIKASKLTVLSSVALKASGGGVIPTSQIEQIVGYGSGVLASAVDLDLSGVTALTESRVEVKGGGTVSLPNAASVNGCSFLVGGGVTLSLPAVVRFDMPDTDGWGRAATYWRAEGVGSVLQFPNLPAITGSTGWVRYLNVEALNGGVVSLPKVTTIADPSGGDSNNGIRLSSKGALSVVDVSALTTFSDGNPASEMSWVEVADGGEIKASKLTVLSSVALKASGGGVIPTSQIKQIVGYGSGVLASAVDLDLSGVTALTESRVEVQGGGTVSLPNAASVDGCSFFVGGGVNLSLPAVFRFDMPDTDGWGRAATYWRAEGVGSVLQFPNLPAITGSTGWVRYLNVEALNGGVVSLPKVTTISDPSGGDANNGILLHSDSTASVYRSLINLCSLESFSDLSLPPRSEAKATRTGYVVFGVSTTFAGVTQTAESGGTIVGCSTDTDSDGFTDVREILLGSDPLDPTSVPSTPPLVIVTASLPNGTVGAYYSQDLAAAGGSGAFGWSRVSGALPPGLSLTTAGVLSGIPATPGTNTFRVQVRDAVNATTEKDFTVTITRGGPEVATIAGRTLYYEGSRPVTGVSVGLSGAATGSTESGVDGAYSLKAAPGAHYTVTPSKSTDATANAGVTTADLTFIRRHVLNAAPLDSGYKVLAADANASASVTTADILLLRRLILNPAEVLPAGMWRFVPSDYSFPNPASPWAAPGARTYAPLSGNQTGQDFVAIKVGDVNGSWGASSGALANEGPGRRRALQGIGMPTVGFELGTVSAASGGAVSVPLRLKGFTKVTSVQFTVGWDANVLEFVGTGDLGGVGLAAGNFGVSQAGTGTLTFSWDDPNAAGVTLADGTTLFALSFTAVGAPGSSTSLSLVDDPTVREATVNFAAGNLRTENGQITIGPDNPEAPRITSLSTNQTVMAGGALELEVTATGKAPLSYQWYRNGKALPNDATSAKYRNPESAMADAGVYTVTVSNAFGSTNSSPVGVVVRAQPAALALALYPGLTIEGTVGGQYRIEWTETPEAAASWQEAKVITLTAPVVLWTDDQPATQRQRYYRAVVVE